MARYEIICICHTARGAYGTLHGVVPVQAAFSSIAYVRVRDEAGREEEFLKGEVIRRIKSGQDTFYVTSSDAAHLPHLSRPRVAEVMVAATPRGREYIKTRSDDTHEDNLLALPSCPGCDEYAQTHAFVEGHEDEDSGNTDADSNPPDQGPPDDE
jgi:hypothetical protein